MKTNIQVPDEPEGIHLNIACGAKLWPGFVNIDFPGNWSKIPPDVECDVRKLTLPDDYADSAYAIHILEHFYRWETVDVLKEWRRVLKPRGKMVIEVPCLDRIVMYFKHCIETKDPINDQMTMWGLYGDPIYKDESMCHRWCFSAAELIDLMLEAGFRDIEPSAPKYHHPARDMRITGYK